MNLELLIKWLISIKWILWTLVFILLLIILFLFFQWINKNNYYKSFMTSIANKLFFPYPKTTGFLGRFFLKYLMEDIYIISELFSKINDNNQLILILGQWNNHDYNILLSNENIQIAIEKNKGIIFIFNTTEEFLSLILYQLSSYEPMISKIIIDDKFIKDEDHFKSIFNTIKKFFNEMINIQIINYEKIDDYEIFNIQEGINYEYLHSSSNILTMSEKNGLLMTRYKNYQWINQEENILQSIMITWDKGFNELLNISPIKNGEYSNNKYLKFWKNFYKWMAIITIALGFFKGILDYNEYKNLSHSIYYGRKILAKDFYTKDEQLQTAQKFLNYTNQLKLKRLYYWGISKNYGKVLDGFLSKVYSSSVFTVYEDKIKEIEGQIQSHYENLLNTKFNSNIKEIKDLSMVIHWKNMMKSIDELFNTTEEIMKLFDTTHSNNIYNTLNTIHKITGSNNTPESIEYLHNLMDNTKKNVNKKVLGAMDFLHNQLINGPIIEKKYHLYEKLLLLTNFYKDNNQSVDLDFIQNLLEDIQDFIHEVNKDIYEFLDNNQWEWPILIKIDMDNLLQHQWILNEDYNRKINEYSDNLHIMKQQLFQWNKTFISIGNHKNNRNHLLNYGDTNINSIKDSLENILSNELIQILANHHGSKNALPSFKNKEILWDIEKLKVIGNLTEFYKNFYDQWGGFNNNGFLMAVGKVIHRHLGFMVQWLINDSLIGEKPSNDNKKLFQNFQEAMEIIKNIDKNLNNIFYSIPQLKMILLYQIETLGNLLLENFNGYWFNNIDGNGWNGEDNIIKAIMNINDLNTLSNIFIGDFNQMDSMLMEDIMPFMNLIMGQGLIKESELPYSINQLGDISAQLILYKNNQDNDLKNLENQIISYNTLKNYDIYKLELKKGFSGSNIFIKNGSILHNILVTKAQQIVEINQWRQYNNMIEFFNNNCYNKIPFNIAGKESVTIDTIIKLKQMKEECSEMNFIFNKNSQKYKKHKEWFRDLNIFFDTIEIIGNSIRINYDIQLQYPDNNMNNHLIMGWNTKIGEKESYNTLNLKSTITSNDIFQIVIDIIKDGTISVIEFEKIVPLNRGCLIFSNNQWGFWKFIQQYKYAETNDGYILKIKIPIIIKDNTNQQQWIITYIKINKIPQVIDKGIPNKI